jgi:GNAT superfamily N-acetyltransferase
MSVIRPCREDERASILAIINAAAEAYRGVIPPDRWHEPYMSAHELGAEIAAGVVFWGCEQQGALAGVMGIQRVRDVDLIRHAYVLPSSQRHGLGAALIKHLQSLSARRMLVGTWSDANWAISFYRRHGFELLSREHTTELLETYWSISARQVEMSVVLASSPLAED